MFNLLFGIASLLICIFLFYLAYKKFRDHNVKAALVLVLLAGLLLRVYTATDLYLHKWDEQYHALVAKNLMEHPLKPTLYDDPVLPYDYRDWTGNHIWLHKQPLPLWAMALSMHLFGVNEIALRIPSVLLSTLAVFLTFMIGRYLLDDKIALLAAGLHAIHGLIIELTGGRVSSDHVEVFFLFFIELGILFAVASKKEKKHASLFIICSGISAGMAVLCKWLPALIVLPVWLAFAFSLKQHSNKNIFLYFSLWLAACMLIILPWQFHIFHYYPREALMMFKSFLSPIGTSIHGHEGSIFYYLDKVRIIFGELIYLPLIWLIYILVKGRLEKSVYGLAVWLFLPLIIFSLSATKRQTYILIAAPAIFFITSVFFWYLFELRKKYKYRWAITVVLFLLIALPVRYSVERIKPFEIRERNPEWAQQIKALPAKITAEKVVLFNAERPIPIMFHTPFIAYAYMPRQEKIDSLKKRGYSLYDYRGGILKKI